MNRMIQKKVFRESGFTLLELLITLVILAMLATLTLVGVRAARKSAQAAIVKTQILQLSIALDNYKTKVGEYPPDDFSDIGALYRHIKMRWPRSKYTMDDVNTFFSNPSFDSYNNSLIFWLGGLFEGKELKGFYLSPTDPLGMSPGSNQREDAFYEFPEKSIQFDGDVPAYIVQDAPIIYFRYDQDPFNGGKYGYLSKAVDENGNPIVKNWHYDTFGVAVPYLDENETPYGNEKYQLIHPGMDKLFSSPSEDASFRNEGASFRTVGALPPEHADNVTSFTEGATIDSLQ